MTMCRSAVLSIHIKKGGHGSLRWTFQDAMPLGKGEYGQMELATFAGTLQTENQDFKSNFPGCINLEYGTSPDEKGKLNLFVEAEFPDIFTMLRNLDSNLPFRLRKNVTFSLTWDGDILTIKHGWQAPRAAARREMALVRLLFTTEGEFLSTSLGQISTSRHQLVMPDVNVLTHQVEWEFKIAKLGMDLSDFIYSVVQEVSGY